MKEAILAAVIVIAIGWWILVRRRARRASPAAASEPSAESPFHELRNQAFTVKRAELGLPAPAKSSLAWGAIMEMSWDGEIVTVVAFADGAASINLSSGSSFIGGGEHSIRSTAQAFIAGADSFRRQMMATDQFPEPTRDEVYFYLRTDHGLFGAAAPENELSEQRHPLFPLFFLAQDIIRQYRLIPESPAELNVGGVRPRHPSDTMSLPDEGLALSQERRDVRVTGGELDYLLADSDQRTIARLYSQFVAETRAYFRPRWASFAGANIDEAEFRHLTRKITLDWMYYYLVNHLPVEISNEDLSHPSTMRTVQQATEQRFGRKSSKATALCAHLFALPHDDYLRWAEGDERFLNQR